MNPIADADLHGHVVLGGDPRRAPVSARVIGMIPKTTRIEGVAVFAPQAGTAS